ncbi:hypothetical protein L204_102514 [Cryptococcus depauperatus]|nr:hypothetical protein L204_00740 [Cryptococcus depauperatus CBS 7855]
MSSNGKIAFSFAVPRAAAKPKLNTSTAQNKAKAAVSKAPSAALFADDDDDGENHTDKSNAQAGPSRRNLLSQQNPQLSRAERKAQAAAKAIDQSIFDYDEHYDSMKAAGRAVEEAKKTESEERKPKYIESFLAAAQTRKLDKLRAEEKMMEREREQEGEEFNDKEKFVTEAYKKQMEEVRKAEEEEKAREEVIRKSQKGTGMTAFYKDMLDSEEIMHAAAVAATSKPAMGPSLTIRPPVSSKPVYDDAEEYDPFLDREAKEAREKEEKIGKAGTTKIHEDTGKEVEINDDGEVVDNRSLLKAGLNITKKPKVELPNSLTSSKTGQPLDGPYVSRAVGTAASYKERMERERRRLEQQYREQEEKKRRDEEEAKRKEEEEARKRRGEDAGEAQRKRQEQREKYLARKRAREEAEKESNKKTKEEQ